MRARCRLWERTILLESNVTVEEEMPFKLPSQNRPDQASIVIKASKKKAPRFASEGTVPSRNNLRGAKDFPAQRPKQDIELTELGSAHLPAIVEEHSECLQTEPSERNIGLQRKEPSIISSPNERDSDNVENWVASNPLTAIMNIFSSDSPRRPALETRDFGPSIEAILSVATILPVECICIDQNTERGSTIVCRVSQNENFVPFVGWGSSFLLPGDPAALSNEALDTQLPVNDSIQNAFPLDDSYGPPPGHQWAAGGSWKVQTDGISCDAEGCASLFLHLPTVHVLLDFFCLHKCLKSTFCS